jgi:hypothetical protein
MVDQDHLSLLRNKNLRILTFRVSMNFIRFLEFRHEFIIRYNETDKRTKIDLSICRLSMQSIIERTIGLCFTSSRPYKDEI